jgi:hypothetical protein
MMMSEPTIQAVLEALQSLNAKVATKDELRALEAKVDAHRVETAKGFAELDRELSGHADPIHRDIEEEIILIKKQLAMRSAARRSPRRRI